jgi:hypothetical protein
MSSSNKKRRRSAAAAAASRANGKKSRGPITPEGKARSAANAPAARHGLSTTHRPSGTAPGRQATHSVCINNENALGFFLLHEALIAEFAPGTTAEHLFVEEMAAARWGLQRAWVMQSSLLDNQMDHMTAELAETYASVDEPTRAALAFRRLTESSPSLATIQRYETRLARQFDRCLKSLIFLRNNRQKQRDLPIFPTEPEPATQCPQNNKENNHDPQFRQPGQPPAEAPPQPVTNSEPIPGLTIAQPAPQVAPICPSAPQLDPEISPGTAPGAPRAA